MIERIEFSSRIDYELDGKLHRPNGPARIWDARIWGVCEAWALYGNWHRYYGPGDSVGSWYMHGVCVK